MRFVDVEYDGDSVIEAVDELEPDIIDDDDDDDEAVAEVLGGGTDHVARWSSGDT
jgi:hypothetical protein